MRLRCQRVFWATLVSFVALGCREEAGPVRVTATTQQQVDDLQGETRLDTLTLEGDQIHSLRALNQLKQLRSLVVSGTAVANLEGLEGLTRVDELLWLENNPRLQTVEELNVAGSDELSIRLVGNDALERLTLAPGALARAGWIELQDNATLDTIDRWDLTRVGTLLAVSGNPQLQSLAGWHELEAVDGDFRLFDARIESLTDLPHLKQVAGRLSLQSLPRLASLADLSSLEKLGALRLRDLPSFHGGSAPRWREVGTERGAVALELDGLPSLTDLELFRSLDTVTGALVLRNLPQLRSLAGFPSLPHGTLERLELSQLGQLASLAELKTLRALPGGLAIRACPELVDLTGLEALCTVGDVELSQDASLRTLRGLACLRTVQDLQLEGLPELVTVAALGGLREVLGDLTLRSLPRLPGTYELAELHHVEGRLLAERNPLFEGLALPALTKLGGPLELRFHPKLTIPPPGIAPELLLGVALITCGNGNDASCR